MINLALLTCNDLPEGSRDDKLLLEGIKQECECSVEWVSWSKPTEWTKYSHAIVRTTWDYTMHRNLFISSLQEIENKGVKLANSLNIIKWNSHKSYLFELEQKGNNVLKSLRWDQSNIINPFHITQHWREEKLLLKPIVGASSQGIKVFHNTAQGVENMIEYMGSSCQDWFLQPFYKEIFNGEYSMIYFNKKFSHAVKKTPKTGDFRSQEEFGSQVTPYEPQVEELKFATSLLQQIEEPLLYARVDFIPLNGLPYLMELELVEPALYFQTHRHSINHFLSALEAILHTE